MFDLEADSGGCRAAIAAGRSSACAATSGVDYGTSPSAELFTWPGTGPHLGWWQLVAGGGGAWRSTREMDMEMVG